MAVMHEFEGKQVVVMGLGRFGGGVGVTRWLAGQGARLIVTDIEHPKRLAPALDQIQDLIDRGTVELRLGRHHRADFVSADLVVVNPAVPRPWENVYLRAAASADVQLTTEISLTIERLDAARIVGVTGSAGKSTTAALCAHVLEACGVPAALGGNIGGSMLELLGGIDERHAVVLELSSAMLHWQRELGTAGFGPAVSVVTGFAPNHLDWHGSLHQYRMAKRSMLDAQGPGDVAILGPGLTAWSTPPAVTRIDVAEADGVAGLSIPGRHNAVNAALAIRAAREIAKRLGRPIDDAQARASAQGFQGLPHRLELVHEANGIRCVNDSKSTTPEATVLALDAVGRGRTHLIAGGYDKQVDLWDIAAQAESLAGLYVIGATADAIGDAAGHRAVRCHTLEVAVARASERAEPGDVVLLSPGCASWDQFENFEERGRAFAACCRAVFLEGHAS